jgi:hypothetical protein
MFFTGMAVAGALAFSSQTTYKTLGSERAANCSTVWDRIGAQIAAEILKNEDYDGKKRSPEIACTGGKD